MTHTFNPCRKGNEGPDIKAVQLGLEDCLAHVTSADDWGIRTAWTGEPIFRLSGQTVPRGIDAREIEIATFGDSTELAVRAFQARRGLSPSGVFDKITAVALAKHFQDARRLIVWGTVCDKPGTPVTGAVVSLAVQFGASRVVLARALSESGSFVCRGTLEGVQAEKAENVEPKFELEVLGGAGESLAIWGIHPDARQLGVVSTPVLTLGPGSVCPWVVLGLKAQAQLTTPSKIGQVQGLWEFSDSALADASALFTGSSREAKDFRHWVRALQASRQRPLLPNGSPQADLTAAAYFVWFRTGVLADPERLRDTAPNQLIEALQRADAAKLVPARLKEAHQDIMTALKRSRARDATTSKTATPLATRQEAGAKVEDEGAVRKESSPAAKWPFPTPDPSMPGQGAGVTASQMPGSVGAANNGEDPSTATSADTWVVSGTVTEVDGTAIPGTLLSVCVRVGGDLQVLATAISEPDGRYEAIWDFDSFASAPRRAGTFVVQATGGATEPLAEVEARRSTAANARLEVPLTIPDNRMSTWTRAGLAIQAQLRDKPLEAGDVGAWSLDETELDRLAKARGLDIQLSTRWVESVKAARDPELMVIEAAEGGLVAAAFFAWMTRYPSSTGAGLMTMPHEELITAMRVACDDGVIPSALKPLIRSVRMALRRRQSTQSPPPEADSVATDATAPEVVANDALESGDKSPHTETSEDRGSHVKTIQPPLLVSASGPVVGDLQDALLQCVKRQAVSPLPERDLAELLAALKAERARMSFGTATATLLDLFRREQGLPQGEGLDSATAKVLNQLLERWRPEDSDERGRFTVEGTVRKGDIAAANHLVRALHRSLRHPQQVGDETITDALGRYVVSFGSEDLQRGGGSADVMPWIMVEVRATKESAPVRTEETAPSKSQRRTIDVHLGSDSLSEWDVLCAAIQPLLQRQGDKAHTGIDLPKEQLKSTDVEFLRQRTALDPANLRSFLSAAELTTQAGRLLGMSTDTPAVDEMALFYGWLRDGKPAGLSELLALPTAALMSSLHACATRRIIPDLARNEEQVRVAIDAFKAREAIRPADDGQRASVGDLLRIAGANNTEWIQRIEAKVLEIHRVLTTMELDSPSLTKGLLEAVGDQRLAQRMAATLKLGRLTMQHAPLTAALFETAAEGASNLGDPISPLAGLDRYQWLDLVRVHGMPEGTGSALEDYAESLQDQVEKWAPTATLTHAVDRHVRRQSPAAPRGSSAYATLLKSLQTRPEVDLIGKPPADVARDLALDKPATKLLNSLLALKSLDVRWDEGPILIEHGFDTLQRLSDAGRSLPARLEGKLPTARLSKIARRASSAHGTGVGLVGALQPLLFGGSSPSVSSRSSITETARAAVADSVDLSTLFGPQDSCQCDPCLSVLGPAAYLADLLKFIDQSAGRQNSARRVLESRRPDLYDLDLSCDNVQLELPHIDLVNEILENAVALPVEIDLRGERSPALAMQSGLAPAGSVHSGLSSTVSDTLGQLTAVEQPAPAGTPIGEQQWIVTDKHRRWSLRGQSEYLGLATMDRRGLTLDGLEVQAAIDVLNQGGRRLEVNLIPGLERLIRQAFGAEELPLTIPPRIACEYEFTEDGAVTWRLDVTASGVLEVERGRRETTSSGRTVELPGSVSLSAVGGRPPTAQFPASYKIIERVWAELNGQGTLRQEPQFPNDLKRTFDPESDWVSDTKRFGVETKPYTVKKAGPTRWTYQIRLGDIRLRYRPARLRIAGLTYQSTEAARDLFLGPQNRNPLAYSGLAGEDAKFPWVLPYDDALSEARALLSEAKVPRLNWLDAMTPTRRRLASLVIALERLGMSVGQFGLITSPANGHSLRARWGLNEPGTVDLTPLMKVGELLNRSGLSLDELQDLLGSSVVNPGGTFGVDMAGSCDVDAMSIKPATGDIEGLFDRLHRYVRLWRILNWTRASLDAALKASQPAAPLSEESVTGLAHLLATSMALRLNVTTVVAWFDGTTSSPAATSLRSISALKQSLELDNDEYLAATLVLSTAADGAPVLPLTSPAELHRFIQDVRFCTSRGHQLSVLAYVLMHDGPACERLEISLEKAKRCLEAARRQLAYQRPAVEPAPPTARDETAADSGRWARWGLEQAVGGLWNVKNPDAPSGPAQLSDADPLLLLSKPNVLAAQLEIASQVLEELLSALARRHQGLQKLADGSVANLDRSALDDLELLGSWLKTARPIEAMSALLATELGAEALETSTLLKARLRPGSGRTAGLELLRFLLREQLSLTAADEFHVCLLRLQKVFLLNKVWRASEMQLQWMSPAEGQPQFAGLRAPELPIVRGPHDQGATYEKFKQLATLMSLAQVGPNMTSVLEAYRRASADAPTALPASTALWEVLANAFGLVNSANRPQSHWVASLAVHLDDDPANWLDPIWIADLCGALALVQKATNVTSTPDSLVLAVAKDKPDAASVEQCRRLLDRMGSEARQTSLRTVANILRESRRDALVAFLTWRERARWPTPDHLYGHHLIDTQMSACMNTTRMLQATAAVQLFVQRCLLGLESEAPAAIFDARRWQWTGNYRVWEANRKVFLYPENWLFPEFRDNKTETFQSFESALAQADASDATANAAMREYLERLVELSRIEVVGLYRDDLTVEPTSIVGGAILYQVGSTKAAPNRLYLRTAEWDAEEPSAQGTRWSGWQSIDLDMDGTNVTPFVTQGDLHIAWLSVSESEPNEDPPFYRVQLRCARRQANTWRQRKLPNADVQVPRLLGRSLGANLNARARRAGSAIAIDLYAATIDAPPPVVIANPNTLTVGLQSQDSRRRGAASPYYMLFLTVSAWVVFTGGRTTSARCRVRLGNVAPDDYNGYPEAFSRAVGSESGPIEAEALANVPLVMRDAVNLRLIPEVLIDNEWKQFNANAAEFDFAPDNPALKNREPVGGDVYGCTVTFQVAGGPDRSTHADSDPLEMARSGYWLFSDSDSDIGGWVAESRAPQKVIPPSGYSFSNGGELESIAGDRPYTDVTAASGGGRLFALRAGPERALNSRIRTFYLREDGNEFIVRQRLPSTSPLRVQQIEAVYLLAFHDPQSYREAMRADASRLFLGGYQEDPKNSRFGIASTNAYFDRTANVVDPVRPPIQFDLSQPSGIYNWEVFFHAPLAAAVYLSRQRQFDAARKWFNYVFEPVSNDETHSLGSFWRFLPFQRLEQPTAIQELLEALAGAPATNAMRQGIQAQLEAWRGDPFNPFAIARLRPSAYEWHVVISYIKNLIAWADQLFRRETRESIGEATLLYVLAAQLLGPRPRVITKRQSPEDAPLSYRRLSAADGDDFGNAWISLADSALGKELRQRIDALDADQRFDPELEDQVAQLSSVGSLYFCVPPNEQLPQLWDAVESRLRKIRHCQNADGVVRQLPLYDPPIDPELVIRARSAGLDIESVLNDSFAPLPAHRFQVLVQKANELCNDVKNLGAALLGAMEKKEAEALSLLRSHQEIEVLRLVERVKAEQVKESTANIESLRKSRLNTVARFEYLQRQLGKSGARLDADGAPVVEQGFIADASHSSASGGGSSLGLTKSELDQITWLKAGHTWTIASSVAKMASSASHLVALYPPAAIWAKPTGDAQAAMADGFGSLASNAGFWERRSALSSGWERRHDDWVQQSRSTSDDIRQIDKQMIALQIRETIATKELATHRKQMEFAANVDDYMRNLKFTGDKLQGWIASQLGAMYFDAYQVAVDLAQRAQRSLRHELGDSSLNFIQPGQWDSAHKGLLSGERLSRDLRRMEAAHLERTVRELEITKHVSLNKLSPGQLIDLRVYGECDIELKEWVFDLDFPGHYFRRIKSVAISLPCVVGPYTGICGTLTLLSSRVRTAPLVSGVGGDAGLSVSHLPINSIATSSSQSDSGLFELNFRDDKFLPFEGAGAVSTWRFELTREFRVFDFSSISDLILHIRYTARAGGTEARVAAVSEAKTHGTFSQLLSLKQDFQRELSARASGAPLTIELLDFHLPYAYKLGARLDRTELLDDSGTAISAKITIVGRFVTIARVTPPPGTAANQTEPFGLDVANNPCLLLHFVAA